MGTTTDKDRSSTMRLSNGSRIAVIGGGPAGSFYSYFFLDLAERAGLDVNLDIYEDQDFARSGPAGCNHCGGIVAESLVQLLASEGINLPPDVVQRSFDSYMLHMDVGSIKIETPLEEKRIAAMFRGAGPLKSKGMERRSFDGFLQQLTVEKGANLVNQRVSSIHFENGCPIIKTRKGISKSYDLIVGAVGLNPKSLGLFEELGFGFQPPKATKTHICEFELGSEIVERYFGNSLQVFLLDLPRLQFAALIPKGKYVTLVLLGADIDKELVESLLMTDEMKRCFPPDIDLLKSMPCKCFPKMNLGAAVLPYSDRIVLVGDSAVSKLYKNGIGAAYITAKAAATTSILHGISAHDFQKHYLPACKSLNFDNMIGKLIFAFAHGIQKRKSMKRGILRMIFKEQSRDGIHRHMSTVLWDTFTGSAPYRDIFFRTLKPAFWVNFIWKTIVGLFLYKIPGTMQQFVVKSDALGQLYQDGENIVTQGEEGQCLYVIQSGTVEVLQEQNGEEIHIAELYEGDFFGEMAVFERKVRSSTVRSKGDSRVLTIDKKTLLPRIQEDPSLAFRMLQQMSSRIREIDTRVSTIISATLMDKIIKDRRLGKDRRAPDDNTLFSTDRRSYKDRRSGTERRKHGRFKVKEGAFVMVMSAGVKLEQIEDMSMEDIELAVVEAQPVQMGQIENISKGGLAFRYIDNKKVSNESFKLDILFARDAFHLQGVPYKKISYFDTVSTSSIGIFNTKQQGVQFGEMMPNQISQLDYFIQNHI